MQEYQIPKEHQDLPKEHHVFPPEHVAPEEYPAGKPEKTGRKKASSRRWMAMIAASFMTMQLMFTYFVPPTTPNETIPPSYTEPEQGGNPNSNVGNLSIHPMPEGVDDSWLKEGLRQAAVHFENLDYIRAAMIIQDVLFTYRMDMNVYDLNQVGYAYHHGAIEDFDGSAVNGFYFYFEIGNVWFENKIGQMESVQALQAYLVSFIETPGGTHYRVLHAMDEFSEFMTYGMDYEWEATFTYLEGTLDDNGNSAQCERTIFTGNNYSQNYNIDQSYDAWANERITGPVGGYAFLNGSEICSILVYDDAAKDFVKDEFSDSTLICMEALTPSGCVDFDHPAVLDATSGLTETSWDDFRSNDSLLILAGPNFVSLKSQNDKTHELSIYGLDHSLPLLPLDMTVALALRNSVRQDSGNVGGDPDVPEEPFETDLKVKEPGHSVDVNEMQQYLADACREFLAGSYIQASMLGLDGLSQVQNSIGFSNIENACFVWKDGKLSAFDGQDLRDGSGVYIYFMPSLFYYSGKEDEILYSGSMFNMTMLVSEKTDDGDRVRRLNLRIENYLPVYGGEAEYYETTFSKIYHSDETQMFGFYVSGLNNVAENTAEARIIPQYLLQGKLRQDDFVGNATYYFGGAQLNPEDTELIPVTDGDRISLVLTEEGGLQIDAMGLLEFNHEKTNDYFDMREIYDNDLGYHGFVFNYDQYCDIELRCDGYAGQGNDEKQSIYRVELPTYDADVFTTGRTTEYWRLLQSMMN